MPIAESELRELILKEFPGANVTITDLAGDNDHYHASIESEFFQGKTRLQQQQMVNNSLKGIVGEQLHALSLTTKAI